MGKVTVTLKNLTHTFAGDVEMLLVAPGGRNIVLLSDAGTAGISNLTVNLDDTAATFLPSSGSWAPPNSTISAKPTNYVEMIADNFPAPAPVPTTATALSTFNGIDPNGTWSLYVLDDGAPDSGTVAGGWCLNLTAGNLKITSITRLSGGAMRLQGTGVPNTLHTIQSSDDLGADGFGFLVNVTPTGAGVWQHDDGTAIGEPKRFYRLTLP